MGLTHQSTGSAIISSELPIVKTVASDKIIALAGNPNVGKSTLFNALTGLNQHTGNWPGKTVTHAQGTYIHDEKKFILVDLPGTYSLMSNSVEEEVARDFICFNEPDATIIVADATCLERNLNLVLQILEVTPRAIVCINLLDEAKKKKIHIHLDKLSSYLKVPVIGTSARSGKGLEELMSAVSDISHATQVEAPISITYKAVLEDALSLLEPVLKKTVPHTINTHWLALKLLSSDESLHSTLIHYLGYNITNLPEVQKALEDAQAVLLENNCSLEHLPDEIVSQIVALGETIYTRCVTLENTSYNSRDRKIDKILTSKTTGIPIMLLLLALIFWLTIAGANYPSQLLSQFLFWIEDELVVFFHYLNAPRWLEGMLIFGIYRTLAWVVSVMLPPMAIFFPLFTLLEDSGYLPRIAFNMDKYFKKACAHGRQSLTMCMGFGCNACGVIGCRIIDSPRERLIAILTNNFVPCNGRFPTLIAIITMFFTGIIAGPFESITAAVFLTFIILFSVFMTLAVSKLLSQTLLKGLPSSFTLELPPYRRPQIAKVLIRSILDRTLFVLGRAVVIAAPTGLIIWLLSNVIVGDISLLSHCTGFLDPLGNLIGLDGIILMAFILGFPANEIVMPIIIMSYMCTGSLLELESLDALKILLVDNGWTPITALCTMLFSLMHFPCGTTCWTIKKETQSLKWTAVAFILPTLIGLIICFIVANIGRLFYLL